LSFCHTNSVAKLDHQTHIYGNSSFTTLLLDQRVLFPAKETFWEAPGSKHKKTGGRKAQAKSIKKLCHIYWRPAKNEGSPEVMHPNHPINISVPANKLLDKQTSANKGTRNFTARQGIYTIILNDTNTIQKHKSLDRIVFLWSHPCQESLPKYIVTTSKHKQECWSHLAVVDSQVHFEVIEVIDIVNDHTITGISDLEMSPQSLPPWFWSFAHLHISNIWTQYHFTHRKLQWAWQPCVNYPTSWWNSFEIGGSGWIIVRALSQSALKSCMNISRNLVLPFIEASYEASELLPLCQ